jgi:hypothetical protein
MLKYYYLEYFCAFLTGIAYWYWLFRATRTKIAESRREAGELLFKSENKRLYQALVALYLSPMIVLLGFYLWLDMPLLPMHMFMFTIMMLPAIQMPMGKMKLEIHERGLIAMGKTRWPYLPWEDILYCQWIRSKKRLAIFRLASSHKIRLGPQQAEQAIAVLGRFVEVRDEQGEILHAGPPKPEENQADVGRKKTRFRNPFQFSILSMLLLTLVVASASSWYAVAQEYSRLQQQALDALGDFSPSNSSWGPVTFLTISNTPRKFADRDMVLLKPFHNLRYLILNQSDITDAAIPDLIGMRSLKYLSIFGTKITPEGVERLRKEMPKTDITY